MKPITIKTPMADRSCRGCGCTDERACPGGCSWVTPNLCSACSFQISSKAAQDLLDQPMVHPVWARVDAIQLTVYLELTITELLSESPALIEQVWAMARGLA